MKKALSMVLALAMTLSLAACGGGNGGSGGNAGGSQPSGTRTTTATALPADGQTTRYRQDWENNQYLELEVPKAEAKVKDEEVEAELARLAREDV